MNIRKRNADFLELVFAGKDKEEDGSESKNRNQYRELMDALLDVDNGRWDDSSHIYHHCDGLFCCAGGVVETRIKILNAVFASQNEGMHAFLSLPCFLRTECSSPCYECIAFLG